MDKINVDELKSLVRERRDVCVSIYMPTHRAGDKVQQDPIRFKNHIRNVQKTLSENGMRDTEITPLLQPAWNLLTDNDFWYHQSDGLAVFIAPGEFYTYRLPGNFDDFDLVAHQFHIKPLLPLLSGDGKFFILALDQKHLRLFQASKFSLSEIELVDTPTSFEVAMRFDDPERTVQFHTGTSQGKGGAGKDRAAIFHGHGVGMDDAKQKKKILEYFHMVNKGVTNALQNEYAPLLLVGVEYLNPLYKEANSYPHLYEKFVDLNPEEIKPFELHKRAWEIIQPYFEKEQQDAFNKYNEYSQSQRASHDLKEIVKASFNQKVDSLFVNLDVNKWGTYDPDKNVVKINNTNENGNLDLLDFAAAQTLLNKGKVFVLQSDEMPDENPISAVFRY